MDWRGLVSLLAIAVLASVSVASTGAPPGPAKTREVTLTVTMLEDGKLAYNGVVPGPTLDVNVGDTLIVRLVNTLDDAVSFHIHGTQLLATMDGVGDHEGTQLAPSYAPPHGEYTYKMRAAFVGTWHYHDHVLGLDGAEGTERGLFGSILVRNGAEPRADAVIDIHMLDGGPNGGKWANQTFPAASDVDLALVGLGDEIWNVTLKDPAGAVVGSRTLAPGISERLRIENGEGTYTWRAVGETFRKSYTGTVTFQ